MRRGLRLSVFLLGCTLPSAAPVPSLAAVCTQPSWVMEGDQHDCRFGTVARAGDVNGDGYDDVLVGSYQYSLPEVHEGVVFVFHGGPAGLSTVAACTLQVNRANARFGDKLSTAGDVNGDGYDDVVVGAAEWSNPQFQEGAAFLFLGGPAGLDPTPAWSAEMNQPGAQFGANIAAAGDVNGDGFDDVVVSAWLYDNGQEDEGAAWVYLGSASGLAPTPAWTAESNSQGAIFGYRANAAGDLNNDGYGDITVGARRYSGDGITREGRAYVYLGGPSGPSLSPDWTFDGESPNAEVGNTVGAAQDVNGDGYDDLIVGAFRWDGPEVNEGKAFLFLGGPGGPATTPVWTYEGNAENETFAYHCVGAGDVDGDGFDDVLIGAAEHDSGTDQNVGAAYVFLGGPGGLSATPDWTTEGDQPGEQHGNSIAGPGDVNGDGRADIMVAGLYRDNTWTDSGRALLYNGCPPGTTEVTSTQARRFDLVARPNPFVTRITLAFELPAPNRVTLQIIDASGRVVDELVDDVLGAGYHGFEWRGGKRRPGIYFARLRTTAGTAAVRLIHLR